MTEPKGPIMLEIAGLQLGRAEISGVYCSRVNALILLVSKERHSLYLNYFETLPIHNRNESSIL